MVKSAQKPDNDWQRTWLATRQHEWTSLGLVASEAGIDVSQVAETLAATGRMRGDRPVTVVNAIGVQLGDVNEMIDTIAATTARGEWAIVPVDPLEDNPAAIAILRATSAALLVVHLGESSLSSAHRVIESVGRDRMIGSIVLEGETASARR
jgi:hypothetical protein